MDCYRLLVMAVILLTASSVLDAYTGVEKLAVVSESKQQNGVKRKLQVLPDKIVVDVTEGSTGSSLRLTLERRNHINLQNIKLREMEHQKDGGSGKVAGFYQDVKNIAAITVSSRNVDGKVVRELEGTLVWGNKSYEIRPSNKVRDGIREVRLNQKHGHSEHVLREADLQQYLQPGTLKYMKSSTETGSANQSSSYNAGDEFRKREAHQSKRSTAIHVEVVFLLDSSIYEYWKKLTTDVTKVDNDILYYYSHIFNGMDLAFRRTEDYKLHELRIQLWLHDIIITKDKKEGLLGAPAGSYYTVTEETFTRLQTYRRTHKHRWNKPDQLTVWTRKDLVYGDDRTSVLGLATLCGICTMSGSTTINKDLGMFSWSTGAHELAHALGSEHDGVTSNGCPNKDMYLMTTEALKLTDNKNALTFSECSVRQMKDCLNGVDNWKWPRICVHQDVCQHAYSPLSSHVEVAPGSVYTLQEQCQYIEASWTYDGSKCPINGNNICQAIQCFDKEANLCMSDAEFKAAPGTPCDINNSSKVCHQGQCVAKDTVSEESKEFKCTSESSNEVPKGCFDQDFKCEDRVNEMPFMCFEEKTSDECAATCQKEGLFTGDKGPCNKNLPRPTPPPNFQTTSRRPIGSISVNISDLQDLDKELSNMFLDIEDWDNWSDLDDDDDDLDSNIFDESDLDEFDDLLDDDDDDEGYDDDDFWEKELIDLEEDDSDSDNATDLELEELVSKIEHEADLEDDEAFDEAVNQLSGTLDRVMTDLKEGFGDEFPDELPDDFQDDFEDDFTGDDIADPLKDSAGIDEGDDDADMNDDDPDNFDLDSFIKGIDDFLQQENLLDEELEIEAGGEKLVEGGDWDKVAAGRGNAAHKAAGKGTAGAAAIASGDPAAEGARRRNYREKVAATQQNAKKKRRNPNKATTKRRNM